MGPKIWVHFSTCRYNVNQSPLILTKCRNYILWNDPEKFLEHWSKIGFSFFEEFSCKLRGEVLGRCFCVSAIKMEKDNAENNAKSNSTDLTPQQIKE